MRLAFKAVAVLGAVLSSAMVLSIVADVSAVVEPVEQAAQQRPTVRPEEAQRASQLDPSWLDVPIRVPTRIESLANATAGLANAITQLEIDAETCNTTLCGPAWRTFTHPFVIDMNDASPEAIARVEREAMAGNEDALAAFLTLAAGESNYAQRSQVLLQFVAAKGGVLALTTLAERALSGYGHAAPSPEAAVLYEYLAWATGNWTSRDLALGFSSSFASVSREACLKGVDAAAEIVRRREIFQRRIPVAESCVKEPPSQPLAEEGLEGQAA